MIFGERHDETRRHIALDRHRRRSGHGARFAQAAEAAGYDHLAAPDHVLGVNAASRPDWGARNTSADLFHDPFVLFGFLSACTDENRLFDRGADPGATPDRAGRQAGGLPRRAQRRPVPARHRDRLERGGVRRPERGFPQSRPAVRGAGPGHAGAVGRAPCHLRGALAPHRGRRHQSAAARAAHPALVRRAS